MATLPYWNNDEVISSEKLNSMVQAIINGDPLAIKVSNATKNDVNQIISYLSSLHDSAKTNLNSATSTNDFDTAYTNMTALVSNKLGSYANDDTVDLYSTGIRASIITFLQAYDSMMSSDRLNNKNTDNTLNSRIDNEAHARSDAYTYINNSLNAIKANGGGRNYLRDSDKLISGFGQDLGTVPNEVLSSLVGETITISVDTEWSGFQHSDNTQNRLGFELSVKGSDGKDYYFGAWKAPTTPNGKERVSATYTLPANVTFTVNNNGNSGYVSINGTGKVSHVKIEKGTIAHDWSPAPEDTNAKITDLDDKTLQNRGTVDSPDFNSLTQAGFYTITSPSNGKNYPTGSWGTLEVSGQVTDGNGRLDQKYVGDNNGTVYTRQYNNNTKGWTAWNHMATLNDIDSVKDLANSKATTADINWTNVVANSNNTYNYVSGSKITLPNGSSITVKDDRIVPHINLPTYLTDYLPNTNLYTLATFGEYDNIFIPSATMDTLSNRPTNPDTGASLTGDCFFTNHYAYSGTTVRAFQKIYSCDYNYVFIRSYNGSSGSWTNWSCLTPYA